MSGWGFDSFNGECKPNKVEKGIKLSFLNLRRLGKANNAAKMQNDLTSANSVENLDGIKKHISRQKVPNITEIANFQAAEILLYI